MLEIILKLKEGLECREGSNEEVFFNDVGLLYFGGFFFVAFICPCIMNIFPNYNQQDAPFLDLFIFTDALHDSGGSAHHQEHKTVHTASGIVNQYCC